MVLNGMSTQKGSIVPECLLLFCCKHCRSWVSPQSQTNSISIPIGSFVSDKLIASITNKEYIDFALLLDGAYSLSTPRQHCPGHETNIAACNMNPYGREGRGNMVHFDTESYGVNNWQQLATSTTHVKP
jgi:hypothetical protein